MNAPIQAHGVPCVGYLEGLFEPVTGESQWTFDFEHVGHARYFHSSGVAVLVIPCTEQTVPTPWPTRAGGSIVPVGGLGHMRRLWVAMADLAPDQTIQDLPSLLSGMSALSTICARKSIAAH